MIQDFKDVFLVILGWLLGTLSPGIGRAILRQWRRSELLRGHINECHELRFTVGNVLFSERTSTPDPERANTSTEPQIWQPIGTAGFELATP